MPTIKILDEHIPLLTTAIDQSIASAKRAQTSGKSPQIKQVYQQHEAELQALKGLIVNAK